VPHRPRPPPAGVGHNAAVFTAVRAAASSAIRTLADNRAVAMLAAARRTHLMQPDRGPRVEQKILHLLANVQADGSRPLAEIVVAALPQLRRGMTLCIITGSTDREWVRPLASLRRRGISSTVALLDRASFVEREDPEEQADLAAVRHALAEYGVEYHLVRAGADLSEVLGLRSRVRV
jgi:hypothetical protein